MGQIALDDSSGGYEAEIDFKDILREQIDEHLDIIGHFFCTLTRLDLVQVRKERLKKLHVQRIISEGLNISDLLISAQNS